MSGFKFTPEGVARVVLMKYAVTRDEEHAVKEIAALIEMAYEQGRDSLPKAQEEVGADDDTLYVCRGDHERGTACKFVEYRRVAS